MTPDRNFPCSILKMRTTGLLNRIEKSWSLVRPHQGQEGCAELPFQAMGLSQMSLGFILLLLGLCLATLILFVELVFRTRNAVVVGCPAWRPRCFYPEDDGGGGSGWGRSREGRPKNRRERRKFEARQSHSYRSRSESWVG